MAEDGDPSLVKVEMPMMSRRLIFSVDDTWLCSTVGTATKARTAVPTAVIAMK